MEMSLDSLFAVCHGRVVPVSIAGYRLPSLVNRRKSGLGVSGSVFLRFVHTA
jgi:hypothetical protein